MPHTSAPLSVPAVFVFDSATGQLMSHNPGAAGLLATLGGDTVERLTLSAVERLLTAGGRTTALPGAAQNAGEMNYELRRRCRRPDGSEFALTRIWAPGSNTILIATDITSAVQEHRQLRFAQSIIDRLMKPGTLGDALEVLLRTTCLYAGWPYAEVWLPKDGVLVRKKCRLYSGGTFSSFRSKTAQIAPISSDGEDGGIVGEAWRSGDFSYVPSAGEESGNGFLALPLKANDEVVAVLLFEFERARARDRLTLQVLDGVSDRLGMALKCRVHAEEMTAARKHLDELLATAGDAIVAMDAGHRISVFNKQAELVFGYSAEEVIGQQINILLPENARASHRAHVARFSKGETSTKLMGRRPEVKGRRKDGSEFPAEASISRVTIDNEVVYTAVVRDLTALREAEKALYARERQMRMIVEAMPFGLAISRQSDGEILFFNGAFAALMETDRPEAASHHIGEFLDGELVAGLLDNSTADGSMAGVETQARTATGKSIWCMVSAVAMNMAGEGVTLVGCYDVTDRRRALEALRKSAHSLAEAERIAHLGNWQLDVASGAIVGSDETFRIFGDEPQSMAVTLPLYLERVHPADRARVTRAIATAMETGIMQASGHRIVLSDGSIRFVRSEAEPVRDADGRIVRLIGTILDITDLQIATEELRAARNRADLANRAKSQFLANMSHELRTPLNAIIGFSELMASDIMGPMETAQYKAYAKDINDSGLHLLAIVNDILDLSRIEIGVTELDESDIVVSELVGACIRTVHARALDSGLALEQEFHPDLPMLRADARLLKQMLLNLLSNALKFTPSGGTVRLAATPEADGSFLFSVSDTGIGISKADIERVTEPFMQVESHLSRRFDGVGLGLALTSQFAQLHGAELEIDSEPGKGTRVDIRFPAGRVVQPLAMRARAVR